MIVFIIWLPHPWIPPLLEKLTCLCSWLIMCPRKMDVTWNSHFSLCQRAGGFQVSPTHAWHAGCAWEIWGIYMYFPEQTQSMSFIKHCLALQWTRSIKLPSVSESGDIGIWLTPGSTGVFLFLCVIVCVCFHLLSLVSSTTFPICSRYHLTWPPHPLEHDQTHVVNYSYDVYLSTAPYSW